MKAFGVFRILSYIIGWLSIEPQKGRTRMPLSIKNPLTERLARRGESAGREFDLFLRQANVGVVPVDADQVEIARIAWRKYGKGRHKAALNFGDCFAYALAKILGSLCLPKETTSPKPISHPFRNPYGRLES